MLTMGVKMLEIILNLTIGILLIVYALIKIAQVYWCVKFDADMHGIISDASCTTKYLALVSNVVIVGIGGSDLGQW